jgi:hypothetical protein
LKLSFLTKVLKMRAGLPFSLLILFLIKSKRPGFSGP